MITKAINKDALAEVYYIISNMEDTYTHKIPSCVKENIVKYMNKDYKYDENEELLPETKVLLAVIIEKYFENIDFNNKLKEYIRYYNIKDNEIKERKYNINEMFTNNKNTITTDSSLIVITEDKWYEKFLKFVKNIFKKSKINY